MTTNNGSVPEFVTYLIETKEGFFKTTLPARYRLTLGPLCPGSKGQYGSPENLVLRVYDGTKQRAVFHNVTTFRDFSIEIEYGTIKGDAIVWSPLPPAQLQLVSGMLVEF